MGQRRGQLAVGLGLGQEVLGFLHDKLHSVGSGDPSQRRLVLTCELDERVGELGGVTSLLAVHWCDPSLQAGRDEGRARMGSLGEGAEGNVIRARGA